jgi:hypothetical protein
MEHEQGRGQKKQLTSGSQTLTQHQHAHEHAQGKHAGEAGLRDKESNVRAGTSD